MGTGEVTFGGVFVVFSLLESSLGFPSSLSPAFPLSPSLSLVFSPFRFCRSSQSTFT